MTVGRDCGRGGLLCRWSFRLAAWIWGGDGFLSEIEIRRGFGTVPWCRRSFGPGVYIIFIAMLPCLAFLDW